MCFSDDAESSDRAGELVLEGLGLLLPPVLGMCEGDVPLFSFPGAVSLALAAIYELAVLSICIGENVVAE